MSKNSIGGFFVDLAMNVDKASFEKGYKSIDGIGNGLNKITGLARNTAVVLSTMAIAGGVSASAEYKVAEAIGISTEKLNKWKAAAAIAGVSANGLTSSMGQLSSIMKHAKYDAAGLEDLAKKLSFLEINVSDLMDLDAGDAYQKIIETAQTKIAGGGDATVIYNQLKDILGDPAQGLVIELERRGMTISGALNEAAKTQYETPDSINKGADFIAEVRELGESFKSISKLTGEEIGGVLKPTLETLNNWLGDNKDAISKAITGAATTVNNGVNKITGWLEANGDIIKEFIKNTAEGVSSLIELSKPLVEVLAQLLGSTVNVTSEMLQGLEAWQKGDKKTANEHFENASNKITKKIIGLAYNEEETNALLESGMKKADIIRKLNDLKYEKYPVPEDFKGFVKWAWDENTGKHKFTEEEVPAYLMEKVNENGGKKIFSNYIQDGIVAPGGHVTQVAPDDWVFAARNVGDLAAAFIPQGNGGGNAQFTINQNFTINGAKDTAQTIRQQAFNGTRSALFESMAQSGRRLQQMSGTR